MNRPPMLYTAHISARTVQIILALIFFHTFTFGQSFKVTQFSREEGLQNELIKGVTTDALGRIWMATDEGIISYNGLVFTQYKDEFPSSYCKSIFKTQSGNILVANDLGIFEAKTSNNRLEINKLLNGESKKSDSTLWFPKQFYQDSKNVIWFSDNHAIWQIQDGKYKKFEAYDRNLTQSWQRSFSFVEDGNGNLMAFSQTGYLYVYNPKTEQFDTIFQENKPTVVSHAINEAPGKILVATNTGIYRYIFSGNNTISGVESISLGIDAAYIEKKAENEYWIGTWTQGLMLLSHANTQPITKQIENYTTNIACYLTTDANGDVWVASDNGVWLVQQNYCESPFTTQSNSYTQHVYSKSDTEVYFTDGNNIFKANPQQIHKTAELVLNTSERYFLSLTSVNNQLWAADASGFISIIENGKIIKSIDASMYGGAIYYIFCDKKNQVWFAQDRLNGVGKVNADFSLQTYTEAQGIGSHISAFVQSEDGKIYMGGSRNGNFLFVYNSANDKFTNLSQDFDTTQPRDIVVHQMAAYKNTIWLATSFGLAKWENNSIQRIEYGLGKIDAAKAVCADKNGHIWFANSLGIYRLENEKAYFFDETAGLPSKTISFRGLCADERNQIWFGSTSGPGVFPNIQAVEKTPTPFFISIQNNENEIAANEKKFLNTSFFKFKFTNSIFPTKYLVYEWRLIGKSDEWKKLESLDGLFISDLPSGKYTLEIRCRKFGNYDWSEPLQFEFTTHTAWYKTWWAVIMYVVLLMVFIWLVVKFNTQRLENQKKQLEKIVKERTQEVLTQQKEILEKNEELNQANEELHTTLELVREQKNEIEGSHKNITDSIQAALKIQVAMLPPDKILQNNFKESFILFLPRNIVSGDFYWFREVKEYTYLVAADCTGHGVPGAFMSMLGISLLNELITEHSLMSPADILNELRSRIKKSLHQEGKHHITQDGMDMSLCRINHTYLVADYAGANNSIYIYTQNANNEYEMQELKGNRMPIGIYPKDHEEFTEISINLKFNDTLYLFSDGYISQFGGTKLEKFKNKRFRDKLLAMQTQPLHQQHDILLNTFHEWKGKHNQVDDILVIGVKIK